MERTFGSMMQAFFKGISDERKQKINACCEDMVAVCPCGSMQDMPKNDKKEMMEKIQSYCCDKMRMMS